MQAQCCRLAYLKCDESLARILGVLRGDQTIYPEGNADKLQFDMSKPEEGYPCTELNLDDGTCNVHESKSNACYNFPIRLSNMDKLPNCSYSFDEAGIRSGVCNRCLSE